MLTENQQRYGQPDPPEELIPLRAGPLTMLYDPASGMLRRIKLGEREVLRGIYASVRDRNWGTVPATIRETNRNIEPESFRLEFDSDHQQGNIHFAWHGTILGQADGTLRYEFNGEAKTTFLRNRIGFCVLHPISECAGARARQIRVDGTELECRFPELIEPQIFGQSSFRELRSVAYEVSQCVWAQTDFEGDTFEMEDQRNWTDASFKTYCTPLTLPFPVEVQKGSQIRQAVTLQLQSYGSEDEDFSCSHRGNEVDSAIKVLPIELRPPPHVGGYISSVADDSPLTLTIPDAPNARLPSIGLGVASHSEPLIEAELNAFRQLRLSHLRVDLRLADPDWNTNLERAATEAGQMGTHLELALHLPRNGESGLSDVARAFETHSSSLARVLVLREGEAATTPETLALTRKHLKSLRVPLGTGSDCNFCELNREQALGRFALKDSDLVFWSVNPQVHAFDHLSIMETLEAQAATVHSARAFAGNRPLVISPVTLKQRFNPVATRADAPTPPDELPPQTDPRQLSHFGAAWTLGSIATLASAGIDHVTFYETTGWRGLMERPDGSPLPEKFPSQPGVFFPLFHIFANLADFSEAAIAPSALSRPVIAVGLFTSGQLKRVLIGNLTGQLQKVILSGAMAHGFWTLHPLALSATLQHRHQAHSETAGVGAEWTTETPIELQPYATMRMDRIA